MPDAQMSLIIAIIVIFLILLSAFFSGCESAYSGLNLIRIKQISKNPRQRRKALRVIKIIDKYEQFLATVLICNNIVNVTVSALVTFVLNSLMGAQGVIIGTIVVTILIILFGEISPKNIAKRRAEAWSLATGAVVAFLMKLFAPVTRWIAHVNRSVAMGDEKSLTATENELIEIVETIEKEGVLEHEESELIQKAIVFDSKSVQTVMCRKDEVYSFIETITISEAAKIILETNYSRFPILSATTGKVVGITRDKDVFKALLESKDGNITSIMSAPLFISYRRLLPYALSLLQRESTHIAVVVDNLTRKNYQGIVTLEDILEELVGEIYDEYDELPKGIVTYGHNTYVVDGDNAVDDLFEILDDTTNPYVDKPVDVWVRSLFKFKGVKPGAIIKYDNLIIKVLSIESGVKMNDRTRQYIKKVEIVEETKI